MSMKIYRPRTLRNHRISHETRNILLEEAFQEFMIVKQLEGLRERTLSDHRAHFQYFTDYLSTLNPTPRFVNEVTSKFCRNYVAFLRFEKGKWDNHDHLSGKSDQKGLAPGSINVRTRTLRAQFNFYVQEGYIEENPWDAVPLMKTDQKDMEVFSKDQLLNLLRQPDKSNFCGYRNFVLMLTLADTGCRISELLGCDIWDVDLKNRILSIGGKHSKLRNGRPVPIGEETAKCIQFLLQQNEYLEMAEPALFITVSGKRMTSADARRVMRIYGQMAGISNVRISPHTLRHTFATHFSSSGGDPFSLQKILGHSSLQMTMRYINLRIEELKRQHDRFSPIRKK